MMRQTAVGFYIKKLELEGVIASPSDGGAESGAGVVVCHSHPMLGGDMDDPVVSAICGASVRRGWSRSDSTSGVSGTARASSATGIRSTTM